MVALSTLFKIGKFIATNSTARNVAIKAAKNSTVRNMAIKAVKNQIKK